MKQGHRITFCFLHIKHNKRTNFFFFRRCVCVCTQWLRAAARKFQWLVSIEQDNSAQEKENNIFF